MSARPGSAVHQRGVVLLFVLIVLLILMIGAVAVMRSMNTSLYTAGNLTFRRDLMNQGETAISKVLTQFKSGGALVNATAADVPAQNYSASALPTNSQGIPTILLKSDANFAGAWSAPDIIGATPDVTIRYVIDRMCETAGSASSISCVQSSAAPTGGTATSLAPPPPPTATVYRMSVRVSGARNTMVFLQTTFTKPD
jgi:type IV pilus assembly protein PilX